MSRSPFDKGNSTTLKTKTGSRYHKDPLRPSAGSAASVKPPASSKPGLWPAVSPSLFPVHIGALGVSITFLSLENFFNVGFIILRWHNVSFCFVIANAH